MVNRNSSCHCSAWIYFAFAAEKGCIVEGLSMAFPVSIQTSFWTHKIVHDIETEKKAYKAKPPQFIF